MMDTPWRFTLLGYEAGFGQPWLLLAAVSVLLVIPVGIAFAHRRQRRIEALLGARLGPRLTPGVSVVRPLVRVMLQGLGLALLGIALAQPQCGSHTEIVKRQGIDLVVALDASKSMLARDVEPDRLARAKLELTTLLDELKGDRVGLVAFAGEAHVQCPLTSDYSAAKLFLRAVDPQQMPQGGTNVGDALRLAAKMLETSDRGAADRVVVLLSDGEDLEGGALAAAKQLAESGIRLFTVGIGSEAGEPIPRYDRRGNFLDFQKDRHGETIVTRLDAAGLRGLAEATDGAYFHQPRGVAIGEVVSRVDRMKKAELESRVSVRYEEQFQAFALPGMLLWLVGVLVSSSARRKEAA